MLGDCKVALISILSADCDIYVVSRFWHERDKLVESQALHRSHVMMPCAARLMAVAVSLPELWRTRQPLLDVEGLDFTLANQLLGGCDRAATRCGHPPFLYLIPISAKCGY